MDPEAYARVQRLSRELTGNNVLLPAAVAVLEFPDGEPVSAPRLMEALGGRLPANRVAEALQRLHRLGVMNELPYPGRPHARLYDRRDGPFWTFVKDWAMDASADTAAH